jgi:hypothetical protein
MVNYSTALRVAIKTGITKNVICAPGVAFLWFEDESDRQRFNQFVREHLCATDVKYKKALEANGVTYSNTTEEYYRSGWTKAEEIKARHLTSNIGISVTPLVISCPNYGMKGVKC